MGELALPGDLLREPLVQADAGLPAEVARQLGRVGEGVTLVAGAGGVLTDNGAAAPSGGASLWRISKRPAMKRE